MAQYLIAKARHEGTKSASAICASGKGVAKTFFQLSCVEVLEGRQYLTTLKRSATATNVSSMRDPTLNPDPT